MATGPTLSSTYEHSRKVNSQSGGCRVTQETHDMEVKGHLITGPELQGCVDSKQQAERMVELQERRRGLQALLSTRLAELRRVCLQEAELTGEVPTEFPLDAGEKPPHVRRRVGLARSGSKHHPKSEEDDASQRKTKKPLFSGTLRRHTDTEQQPSHGKRTVHRGCHTDNTVKSESSSTSDSTSQENGDTSDGQSPSRTRLAPGSPDSRFCRKLSPVEIYYEMRARRNSVASSASPSRSLPRSMSNLEGRSVPATPLLTRNGPNGVHIRSESSSGTRGPKQWSDNPEVPQPAPVPSQEGSPPASYEQNGCSYSAQTRRSNSSEALLDRNTNPGVDEGVQRSSGLPARNGPYKSSEALQDGRLKQAQRGSPERQVNGHSELSRVRSVSSGRGVNGPSGGYSEILLDYVWSKQQKMQQAQQQQLLQQRLQAQNTVKGRAWPEPPSGAPPPYMNGFPQSQALILGSGPPAYSPLMLRGNPGEPRRVKVSRTKSCGPFIPLQQHQQDNVVITAFGETPTTNGTSGMGHYSHADQQLGQYQPPLRPPHYSAEPPAGPIPDESTRNLHKALALEGLRDWYLRNALGQTSVSAGKGQEGAPSQRRRTTASLHGSHPHPPLKHQPQSFQGDTPYPQLPQSATFHGHPIHGRSVDLSPYQDSFPSKMQDLTLKDMSNDRPSPGTLV